MMQALNYQIDGMKEMLGEEAEEISYIDAHGQEFVKRGGGADFQNVAEEPYFKSAISGGNYLGDVEYTDNKILLRVATQIENKDREIIGVTAAVINLTGIQEIIGSIRLGESGYVYIVDNNGRLIASSEAQAGSRVIGADFSDRSWVADVIGGKTYDGLKKFETRTNAQGDKVIIAGRPIPGINWFVLSEWPQSDAYSVIVNILMLTLLIALITLILIILLGFIFARQVEKPLKSLRHGAMHITRGDLDYRLRIKTGDEFEILGSKFNDMIKILKENRKLRDEFVFISAHELRTPVTAIKGYLSMILDESFGKVPAKIRENLDIVNASNERLVQLVHDLLEIARSEAGKMKIDMIATPIKENVTTVTNELKSLADQKGIKLAYDENGADSKVMADPYKLKEVLTNLIGNAIKYTLGKGDIEIGHEIKDGFLWTHIKDHGMGMAPEEVKQLFSKFYRVQNEETKNIEGTGLGLFICKEIAERMGGEIKVESEKGKGSTFSFSLKLTV